MGDIKSERRDTTALKKKLNNMSGEERKAAGYKSDTVNRKDVSAFMETNEGKELFKETKRYKSRMNRSRILGGKFHKQATVERNTQKDMQNQTYSYDGNSNMSYDDTVRAAKQGSVEAQAALDRQKQKSMEKAEREYKPPKIQKARGAIRKVGDKISDFRDSDFGKATATVTKQLVRGSAAIAGLSIGAGMSGNLQGAITGQQIMSGLTEPLLANTTRTARRGTTNVAEKVLALSGKSKEDMKVYGEEIWNNGKYNHKYDNMSQKFDDFAEKFAKETGCKIEDAERLNTEIQLGLANDKNFDVEGVIKKYINDFGEQISEEIKKRQIEAGKDMAKTYGESMIYSQMDYAESSLGIEHSEYIDSVTNKISNYKIQQYHMINAANNSTVNQTFTNNENAGPHVSQTTRGANVAAQYAHQTSEREAADRARDAADRASNEGESSVENPSPDTTDDNS